MSTRSETVAPARTAWVTPAALAALALVVRLPAFFASKHLSFDDGVYSMSVVDMRHGLAPYRGVFSAEGPLHFPLLYAGDMLGFHTIDAPRVIPVLAGVFATLAVWAVGRRIGTPTSALLAGALVATTGSMLWTTGPVTGDGPAIAFAIGAVWAAVVYRDDGRVRTALLAGAAIGGALAVKPLLFAAAVPVGWWLWSRRRPGPIAGAVAVAGAVWLASALPWGLQRVWDQSIAYNAGAGPRPTKISQFRKLLSTAGDRDVIVLGAVILGIVAAVLATGARERDGADTGGHRRTDTTIVVAWLAATALVLVFENALFQNHVATIIPPLALLVAVRPPPLRWFAIALVALVPYWAVHVQHVLRPAGYRGDEARMVSALRALPDGAQVIHDDPGFVWRAGKTTPALLNDTSIKRIDQGMLTTNVVARAAADPRVCAVVVWTPRFGEELPGLPEALTDHGFHVAETYPRDRALWLRACTP